MLALVEGALGVGAQGGVYVWNLREVPNSSGLDDPPKVNMSYDLQRFQVRAHVTSAGIIGAVEIFEIRPVAGQTGQYTYYKIATGPNFLNTYTRIVGVPTYEGHNALLISKNVAGDFADLTTPFTFTLNLTNPALTPPNIGTQSAIVVVRDSNPPAPVTPPRTVNITSGTNTFTLLHNEALLIPELPSGTRFQVTEAAALSFRPEASVTAINVAPSTGTYPIQTANTELVTGTYIIHQVNDNIAAFTNTHVMTPPTGLSINNAPWIALMSAAILLSLTLVVRKRKRIEELPVV
jgi:hypothetical protein